MPVPVAETAEELHEQLTDKRVMAQLLKDPEAFAEHIESSINARIKRDPSITAQVGDQTNAFMTEWLKNNGQTVDEITARRLNLSDPNARGRLTGRNAVYNKKAAGAKYDKSFGQLSDLVHAVSSESHKTAELEAKLYDLRNDLSSIKPSDGGFLIPEILRSEMLRIGLEKSIVRSRARVIPMDSLTVAFPAVDSTSNVSSVYGGVIGYWTEEGATLTESQPRFSRVELKAQKLTLYTEIPNELLQDARPALDTFLEDILPEALVWFEDLGFTLGGGVGEPLGFLNAPAAISISRTGAGQNVDWADIANMYSRMLPQSLDRAVWLVSPDLIPNLLTMPFTVGGTTTPMLLGGGGFASGATSAPLTILGRPVIVSEKMRAAGTSGDINFVDFGFYLVGDRQAMSMRQSEEFRFQNDITCLRLIERVDGRPWLNSAITPYNNGATLSPFVKLA
jgi:HK97 family phage major capsid protein